MAKILIIDDDPVICEALSGVVRRMGHEVKSTFTLREGYLEAGSRAFDVVFLDVQLPDGNGLDILPKIRELPSAPEVIIITSSGTPDGAELAITSGAWDYVEKPVSTESTTLPLMRALQYRAEKNGKRTPVALKLDGLVGSSPRLKACTDLLAQAVESDANVLITGETGTGKELLAFAIHNNSRRADENFVVVDCAALPATLVETMLFGHVKGAFTGADKAQDGLIKQAHGGTLFLDEVGELPLSSQKAFLRVLQERRFRPIGARQEMESHFRLVAATHRDLDTMAEDGELRKDLLFRLRSITIHLPPLRDRMEDIPDLTVHHVRKLCRSYGIGAKGFSPEFFEVLAAYHWPGNIRELVNTLERSLTVAFQEPILFPYHLPPHIRSYAARASLGKGGASGVPTPREESAVATGPLPSMRDFREAMDRQYLRNLLAGAKGDVRKACAVSGLSRSSLYGLVKKHNLPLAE